MVADPRRALARALPLACALALPLALAGGPAGAETPLERGTYLATSILACGNCHTPMGPDGPVTGMTLAGGTPFEAPAFTVHASNITPDERTGVGGWSDADLRTAIVGGVRPDGMPLAPIMPYAFYQVMRPGDLDALIAYLRTVPAVAHEIPPPDYRQTIRAAAPPGFEQPATEADLATAEGRGKYLVGIGHCMECHTTRGPHGEPEFATGFGAGGMEFPGPWGVSVAPNITSSKAKGLGGWTDAEIKRAISEGVGRDGRRLKPPMAFPFYARLKPQDLDDIVAYLRTVPAVE
jgi:mono/diheme cytochrome c family protein